MRKITLLLVGVLLTASLALGQTVTDITFDEGFLVNLNADQSARAYNLTLDADTAVTVNTRYLGAAFPFSLEVFDASGQTLAAQTVDTAGDVVLDLPAGAHMLLVSVASGNSGQVILLLSDATSPADANTNADGPPLSGAWQVTYGQSEITGSPEFECEQYIPLADAELPADGSTVMLSLDGEPRPLDLHAAVAPDGVQEAPDFFMTETLPDGRFEVTPGIQGAPFVYTYTVNSAEYITIDYLQTLPLSDCELAATVELTYAGDAPDTDATTTAPSGSVEGWIVIGVATEASPPDGEFICGAPTSLGADWLFDAPPSFVDQVADGYGETLTFELRRRDAVQTPVTASVMLVVGNGILLSYELPTPFANDFTRYEIPLTETAGWVDVDGMFDTSDPELFQQMLSDVTRVQIPGNVPDVDGVDTDGFCLRGAAVGAAGVTAADTNANTNGDSVPYFVASQLEDVTGEGVPVGCDGYLIEQQTDTPVSADPAQNIRVSMNALLNTPATPMLNGVELTNYIANQNMTLNSVEVDANGHATINFDGEFLLIGTCGDPHIEAQLLLSVFADPQVTSARINVNGENIKPFFDMSGQTEPDEIYTPDDIPLRSTN